jgi:hypothetical protein
MVKGAGPVYAGSKIKMASAVDFSTKKLFKVWSPVAGKKLLLKFGRSCFRKRINWCYDS